MALLVLVVAESLPSRCPAQNAPARHADSSLLNSLIRVSADSSRSVRLASHETGRLDGRRVSLVGDSVFLDTYSGMRAIAVADVDSVWVQRGTAALLVGIITGFPCAAFGAMIGGFIGGDPDSKGSPGREALLTIVGFLGGGLVCGSVGAAVGSLIRRWELEYPVSPEPSPG
jgi:hypothetical protein